MLVHWLQHDRRAIFDLLSITPRALGCVREPLLGVRAQLADKANGVQALGRTQSCESAPNPLFYVHSEFQRQA